MKKIGRLNEKGVLMTLRVGDSELATMRALAKTRGQKPQSVIRGIYRRALDELSAKRQP